MTRTRHAVRRPPGGETLPYDEYIEQRALQNNFELAVSERYDRAVLTVAGGALGLSLTFLGSLADAPSISTRWLLCAAWISLLATVVGSLASLLTSQSAIRRVIDQLDEQQLSGSSSAKSNPYARLTNALNIGTLVTLVAGIAMLCWFTVANTKWSEGKNEGAARLRSPTSADLPAADSEAGWRVRATEPTGSTAVKEEVTSEKP